MEYSLRKVGWLMSALFWVAVAGAQEPPAAGPAQAGHLVAASGKLAARNEAGEERRLQRRDPLFQGDTVVVGENGFAQIRFTDGGLVALRPGSEFTIAEYRFQGKQDGSEKASFELVKGGLRTITGAVGRERKENYEIATPVATIGIRGTHYGLRYCDGVTRATDCGPEVEKGLYGGVVEGAVAVRNEAGELVFRDDRYFHVAAFDQLPKALLRPPAFIFDGLELGERGERQEEAPPEGGPQRDEKGEDESNGEERETPPRGEEEGPAAEGEGGAPPDGPAGPPPEGEVGGPGGEPPGDAPTGGPGSLEGAIGGLAAESFEGMMDFGPKQDREPVFQESDTRSGSPTTLADGSLIAIATQLAQPSIQPSPYYGGEIAEAVVQSGANRATLGSVGGKEGVLTQFAFVGSEDCYPQCRFAYGAATLGAQGGIAEPGKPRVQWGRWDGEWSAEDKFGIAEPRTSWHYVYSPDLTSQGDLAQLKAGNVIGFFNPLAGTAPTDELGNVGSYGQSFPYMVVDFGHAQVVQYAVLADFTPATGRSFYGRLRWPVGFSGARVGGMPLDVECTGCAEPDGAGQANVTFVGSMASHAIGSFEMHSLQGGHTAVGAFVLQQGANAPNAR